MQSILIVDDNTTLAYFTGRFIQHSMKSADITLATSCEEARAYASDLQFSTILIDNNLPDGNGVELLMELKTKQKQAQFILISGDEFTSKPLKSIHYLQKPYESEDLLKLITKTKSRGKKAQSEQQPRDQIKNCNGYDRHAILNKLGAAITGIKALEQELNNIVKGPNSVRVHDMIGDYSERICDLLMEISKSLPECSSKRKDA